ncbi:LigB-domain-containing protein [Xylariaceae sp. FL0804]|nr:LigB-domain-containing protein [Xylariaceae sp. FL0804]
MAIPAPPGRIFCVLSVIIVAVATLLAIPTLRARLLPSVSTSSVPALLSRTMSTRRPPVYFFSHGGPTVMYDTDHPVYPVLQSIGREITEKVKPKAVVVFSGHWEAGPADIEVNTAEKTDLIYDFYNFPPHYYKAQYPHRGSPELGSRILSLLGDAGIKAAGVSRGPDHGVWSGFHVAFHPEKNPLGVPLVQVSLYGNEDVDAHYRLGRAVAALRSEGVVVIGAGMSVHNLRDFRLTRGSRQPLPYTVSFDEALRAAVEVPAAERQASMAALARRPDARQAHPTFDHLMPVYVAAGAAGDDEGKRTWTLHEGCMGWAQYRFGEVPS